MLIDRKGGIFFRECCCFDIWCLFLVCFFSWLIFLIVVIIIHGRHFWWLSFGGHSPNYCRPPLGVLDDDHGRSLPKRVNPWSSKCRKNRNKMMTIWWPRGHHFKMMTMVVLVVILWSSYDDHGHHSKMMTTSGVMVIILVECSPERSPERSPHPFWSSLFFFACVIF